MSADREQLQHIQRAAEQDDPQHEEAAPDRMRQAAMVRRKSLSPTGSGAALDAGLQRKMEKSLGADLSGVRIHTDGDAAERSEQLGARAYTEGADVHFGAGQFQPGTKEGDRLIAHELTHVVQGGANRGGGAASAAKSAGGGGAVARKEDEGKEAEGEEAVEVSSPDEAPEKEADEVADKAVEDQHGEGEAEGKEGEAEGAAADMGADAKKDEPPKIQAKLDGAARKAYRKVDDKAPKGADLSKMKAFENDLGLRAMNNGKAQGAAKQMVDNIHNLLKAEADVKDRAAEKSAEKKAKLDKLISDFTGTDRVTVAGAVGKNADVLSQVFKEGNLREQLTVVFNFSAKFPDLVMGKTSQEREDLFTKAEIEDQGGALETRLEEMVAAKKAKLVENPDGEPDGRFEKTEKGRKEGDPNTFPRLANASTAEAMQKEARISDQPSPQQLDQPKVQDIKDDSLEKGQPDKSVISDRELAFMGQQGKAVEDQTTTWAMGVNQHTEKTTSEFSKDLAALQMPFGAGPSGTTSRICDTSRLLGIEPDVNTRLACIGYLVPIHAHSVWEVVDGAATQGVEGIDWRSLGVNAYEELKPFEPEEIKALKTANGIPLDSDMGAPGAEGGEHAGAADDPSDGTAD